ncbi:Kiwa anti-phage protein KwaB-like domain-containing protein [Methylophaga sp.]|uniref:Kiwa anti-phage protein KwaB-like domain-containing protein n=1 Tax=Methylophaga sp. TaxID=2024840 RepID=UPI003A905C96
MLDNFQLAAIVKLHGNFCLKRLPLTQQLQISLSESWCEQYESFLQAEEIDFNPGYKPDPEENFKLETFSLPAWMENQTSQTIGNIEAIAQAPQELKRVSGIAAFARNANGEEVILFQNFNRSHVINPGKFLFLTNDNYESLETPALALDDKVSCAFNRADSKLLFHSFRNVNTFLPLAEFYSEASQQQITDILNHDLFDAEDIGVHADDSNQWFRKRFAMLADSGVLDNYTALQIQQQSQTYPVNIQIQDNKIIFPADKAEAKQLLLFLNEELFRGAITQTLYETNSKREAS